MQVTREVMSKLLQGAMVPLAMGLGFTAACLEIFAEVLGMMRGH